MIELTFKCGHTLEFGDVPKQAMCMCGETRVVNVKAPRPMFRGAALGPCAVKSKIRPIEIPVVTGGAIPFKE